MLVYKYDISFINTFPVTSGVPKKSLKPMCTQKIEFLGGM